MGDKDDQSALEGLREQVYSTQASRTSKSGEADGEGVDGAKVECGGGGG